MLRLRTAGLAVVFLATGCAVFNQEDERLRVEQVEAAVAPMARIALDTGQTDTATRLYNRLLDVDPQSLAGHMGLGDVALATGDSAGAADWYFAAIVLAQTPEQYHEAVLAHGRAALDAGLLAEARESFLQLTEPDAAVPPNFAAWGHNGTGLTLLLEGDLAGAIAYMEQAVRHAPREPTFRENLQRALAMQEGEFEREAAPRDGDALAPEAPARQAPALEPAPRTPAASTTDALTDTPEAVTVPTDEPATTVDEPAEAAPDDAAPASDLSAPPAETQPMDEGAIEPAAEALGDAPDTVAGEEAEGAVVTPADQMDGPSDVEPVDWFDAELGDDAEPWEEDDAPASTPDAAAGALIVTSNGQRYLQLGAYRNRDAAETLVDYFSTLTDEPVFIATDPINGEPMHRVRAGPLESDASMRRLLEAIEDASQSAY